MPTTETPAPTSQITRLVNKFLAWPLPASVCADQIATHKGAASRLGTNLLTAEEAQQMLEYLLSDFSREVQTPALNLGETYVGAFINSDGIGNHTILLSGDQDDAPWQKQMDWAKSIGGDLPNRIEQAMLYDKFKDQFQEDWYWSNTQHASSGVYAWLQDFSNGVQLFNR